MLGLMRENTKKSVSRKYTWWLAFVDTPILVTLLKDHVILNILFCMKIIQPLRRKGLSLSMDHGIIVVKKMQT